MQVVVWIIIIMVIIFLIWLLRRWIKRLIFILILLILAFLIYGIFNPSGASRLWYNVRTFPERMASWMGSGKEFLNYDNYKSKISSIGDNIGDTVDSIGDKIELSDSDDEIQSGDFEEKEDIELKSNEKEINVEEDKENFEKDPDSSTKGQTIKTFPKSIKFVQFPELKDGKKSEIVGQLTGYSKSDLLSVVNKYIEENLDDYTDILVTVEYEDDSESPKRIILETQSKSDGNGHSVYFLSGADELLEEFTGASVGTKSLSGYEASNNNIQDKTQSQKKTSPSNKLTQKDQQEAEEIFSILF